MKKESTHKEQMLAAIRLMLRHHDVTKTDLAARVIGKSGKPVSQEYISQILSGGRVSVKQLLKINDALEEIKAEREEQMKKFGFNERSKADV